nr:DUF6456 domain-containing protein [uncultured Shimia sp.]
MGLIGQISSAENWLPDAATRYLLHTEHGLSIREIARSQDCHPSTVLRQIRKFETLRDDPLMDEALANASTFVRPEGPENLQERAAMTETETLNIDRLPDAETLKREGLRVLRRLCETGAVLAVAKDMEKAVIVREAEGATARTGVVDRAVAQAMVLKDWISCRSPGRISRYHITAAGRSALNTMLAEAENQAQGFAEAQVGFEGAAPIAQGMRFSVADSPLTALARRRDRDGSPFLHETLVAAGERLREDFELAQMGPRDASNWKRFLSGENRFGYVADQGVTGAPAMARERVAQAVRELGDGLADVALRCCCFLEGLESAEKRLGWSARSGKIVLRIALIRLSEYYRSQAGGAGRMIG